MKSETKTNMIRVNEHTHRLLKGLAGLNGLTLSEMLEKMVSFWKKENQDTEECELCRKYGNEPNEETRQTFEDTDKGIGLSKVYHSSKAMMKDLLKDAEE